METTISTSDRWGLIQKHSTLTPLVDLIVAVCSRHSTPIFLASDRKSLDFYRSYLQSDYPDLTSTIQNMGT